MAFTRSTFDAAVVDIFHQACRNVEKDGVAHTVIHAFDKRGNVVAMILETYADVPSDEERLAREKGIVLFRGPFRDRLPGLADLLGKVGAVAAIHIAEGWKAADDGTDDRPPSEREDRDEVVMTQGAWPGEVYERALIAQIVRDGTGKPTTRPYPDSMAETFSMGWLAQCLPDLHGRRRTPTV